MFGVLDEYGFSKEITQIDKFSFEMKWRRLNLVVIFNNKLY